MIRKSVFLPLLAIKKINYKRSVKKNIKIARFWLFGFTAMLVGAACQTPPTKFYEHKEGQWSGQVQAIGPKNTKKKSAIPVTVVFKAGSSDHLRMDISTVSGFYVGSVLVKGDRFRALMAREKKFYYGKIRKKTMKKILSIPLDPRWLRAILFESPLPNWKCKYSDDDYLSECVEEGSDFKVVWKSRTLDQRLLEISINDVLVKIFLNQFQAVVDGSEQAFRLAAPSGFKKIRVR